MNSDYKTISFPKEQKVKIGDITYIVNSYFDENGEALTDKIKRLLIAEIKNYSNLDVLNSRKM